MMRYIRLFSEFCCCRAAKVVKWLVGSEKSLLESLPQELLIKVICGVDHDDLKSLECVSTTIKKATLIAKEIYFDYTTPKKTLAFRNSIDLEEIPELLSDQEDDIEARNAPIHDRHTKTMTKEQLLRVAKRLFP